MKTGGKIALIIFIVIILLFVLVLGFGSYYAYQKYQDYKNRPVVGDSGATYPLANSLQKFTNSEFETYTTDYEDNVASSPSFLDETEGSFDIGLGAMEESEGEIMPEAAPSDSAAKDSITNVQEAGVDEGDIVKTYKDFLVILRRGRLFTVRLEDAGQPVLNPVYAGEAYAKGSTLGGWYDELLIYEDTIVVIGYSYSQMATEIGLFKINDQGQISHQNTFFIDSNDYYSSRNYASRLVDGKLVLYMPYYLFTYDYESADYRYTYEFPQIKKWLSDNELSEGKDLLKPEDIYQPLQDSYTPTMHTVLSCDLSDPDLACQAQAVLGPYARSFYVSPESVYVWLSNEGSSNSAMIYSLPLDLSAVTAIKAEGAPIDQFSFKERDGNLNVLVQDSGFGDAMWNSEYSTGDLSLLKAPLSDFKDAPKTLPDSAYQPLPNVEGYTVQNKYIGDYLLYGSGSSWWGEPSSTGPVYVVNYQNNSEAKGVNVQSSVDRIEALGDQNAVVVGQDANYNLLFNWIALSDNPALDNVYTAEQASQGETRSHGFFYSQSQGILGLPIRSEGQGFEQLFTDSAQVKYLAVDLNSHVFADLGSLSAPAPERTGNTINDLDNCLFSCVDWYGNARPIFTDNRIFALLGYELIEGQVLGNQMEEVRETNYLKASQ